MTHSVDPGLQPERTLLAWRRTTLSLALGSAALIRLTVHDIGYWAALFGVGGAVVSLSVWVVATRRFGRASRIVHGSASGVLGGRSVAATAAVIMVLTGTGAIWVVSR